MHSIEPFYRWEKYYLATEDDQSPFFGREYTITEYTNDVYGYFLHTYWDFIGSETLYLKLLFVDYREGVAILELIGEWNDTLHNDIMHLKRNVVDPLMKKGITQFILIGENVFNFHGSDDCYYEEWFEDVEEGWIAAVNFREFVLEEWEKFNLDWYINFGGSLDIPNWRTLKPQVFYGQVKALITQRIELI